MFILQNISYCCSKEAVSMRNSALCIPACQMSQDRAVGICGYTVCWKIKE